VTYDMIHCYLCFFTKSTEIRDIFIPSADLMSEGSMIKDELHDDGGLLSLEKLDRTSPDLWPEKIPGITDFIAMSDTPIRTPAPEWSRGLSQDDMSEILELSSLQPKALIMEIQKIYDEAYQLGVSEAKEMTRELPLILFVEYRNMKVLLDFGVICAECWQHIFNFHSFQQWVLNAQENEMNLTEILCEEISSAEKNFQNETELSLDPLNQSEKKLIEINPYECETCGASFTQYGNLRRHIRKKHKLQPLRTWTCLDCNKLPPLDIVDINDDMSTDSEPYSNTNDLTACISPVSLKADTDKENILAYDDLIAEQKSYLECPKCEKHLNNFSMLNEHFQSEHSEESCYIVCCDEPLYDRRSIVEHLQLHENPSAFSCDKCKKKFKNSRGLNSHKLQVHSESRSAYHLHLCYCKRTKKLHADNKVKEQKNEYDTFVCCQRKKKILEDDALIAEWKKDLECSLCNLTFPYYSLMRVHFYLEHPGEKCYISCCDRKISRISDAIEHIRVHLDPKIYQCKVCNVMFSSRSSLLKHMRLVHLDLLPKQKWACNECDKTFKIRQILIRHKNVYHSKKV
ncbi:hypothetical protein DOY81_003206, partial [Sarcophaga bullata]